MDLKFGDWIRLKETKGDFLVTDVNTKAKKFYCLSAQQEIGDRESIRTIDDEKYMRLPRPGEVIHVSNLSGSNAIWYTRRFVRFKNTDFGDEIAICISDFDYGSCGETGWAYWKLVNPVDERKEKLDLILKELEIKGSQAYNELAEIILTARERRTK